MKEVCKIGLLDVERLGFSHCKRATGTTAVKPVIDLVDILKEGTTLVERFVLIGEVVIIGGGNAGGVVCLEPVTHVILDLLIILAVGGEETKVTHILDSHERGVIKRYAEVCKEAIQEVEDVEADSGLGTVCIEDPVGPVVGRTVFVLILGI